MSARLPIVLFVLILAAGEVCACGEDQQPWRRHVIDDSSRGADGVRGADVNGDGWLDLTTGWEEGGRVRVYLHPGAERAAGRWPAVTVGRVRSPEDAVFADLDGDGRMDVVSSCEGEVQSVFVHWVPSDPEAYLDETAWTTQAIPALEKQTRWMFCLPMQVDGRRGIDLVLGSKEPNAVIGWLEAPENPRDLSAWRWHPLYEAGWIMSLEGVDVNGDGRLDILASDRKGRSRGVVWIEHPGVERAAEPWKVQRIGGERHEVMFLDHRTDAERKLHVAAATRDNGILTFRRENTSDEWHADVVPAAEKTGTLKAVRWADVDLDGRLDLVYSCENAVEGRSGVVWLKRDGERWVRQEISGPEGVKFDLLLLIDLDGDGDLDVVTCEERDNLGVIWYENPTRGRFR